MGSAHASTSSVRTEQGFVAFSCLSMCHSCRIYFIKKYLKQRGQTKICLPTLPDCHLSSHLIPAGHHCALAIQAVISEASTSAILLNAAQVPPPNNPAAPPIDCRSRMVVANTFLSATISARTLICFVPL